MPHHYTWEFKEDDIAYASITLANFAHGTPVFPSDFNDDLVLIALCQLARHLPEPSTHLKTYIHRKR